MKTLRLALLLATITSCATGYKPEDETGGYSDRQVGENKFMVTFRGNGFTSKRSVEKHAHRRAREICINRGYEGYELLDEGSGQEEVAITKSTADCEANGKKISCTQNPGIKLTKNSTTLLFLCYPQAKNNTSKDTDAGPSAVDNTPNVERPSKPFKAPVFLIVEGCKILAVELRKGSLSVADMDDMSIMCEPSEKSPLTMRCIFFDKTNKPFAEKMMIGGIIGQEGLIFSEDNADKFFLNLTSEKFYSESNLSLEEGLIRGKKVCTGNFVIKKLEK